MEKEQFIKEVLPFRLKLMMYAQQFLKDTEEAEDIIQEVFLKLWCTRDALHQYNSIYALSVTITQHLCLNRLKVRQRSQQMPVGVQIISEILPPDIELIQKDDVGQLMRIINCLPDLQQAILRMKHIEGLEVEEIAELTGSKPEAIRMNLSRARKRVKELFFKAQDHDRKI